MYGEDSSGRKVSLLNDDTSTSSRTTTNTTATSPSTSTSHYYTSSASTANKVAFSRPRLPDRNHYSTSSSSICSSHSTDSYRSSRPSSISCSPRRSPPTPSLVRLDSQSSSVSSSSPMTPPYHYDPMDPRNAYKGGPNAQQGFFMNTFPPTQAAAPGPHSHPHPYASMPDPSAVPQPFYPMSAQQPLPAVFDLNESFSQQATLNPLQTGSLAGYAVNPGLNPLSPTHSASMLPTPSTILPATVVSKASTSPTEATATSATSATSSQFPVSNISPVKTDPSTPITSNQASAKGSTKNSSSNNNNNNNPSLPKKKYPCPHAKTAGCKDTFTTSGHAARHGKKHTGEKNVSCPTCGKTFTRKDNMKQHERTHKNQSSGAGAINRVNADAMATSAIVASHTHPGRGRAVSASTVDSAPSLKDVADADMIMMDPSLESAPHMLSAAGDQRPEMPRSKLSEILEQARHDRDMDADGELDPDAEGESPALDALATVAAGEIVQ